MLAGFSVPVTGPRFARPPSPALVELAQRHLRSRPLELAVRKMAPDDTGAMRKIPADARIEAGWALARLGDGGWWPAIDRGLRGGRLDDEVAVALAEILRAAPRPVAWVTTVPSTRLGDVCTELAERLAAELGVEHLTLVARKAERPPQREMANAVQQVANVRGAFAVTSDPPKGPCLLVDDLRHSGWTQAMTGGQLRRRGAGEVYPLVLTTAF